MPVKKQTQKQSQIVQVIIGAAILDKLKKRKPKKKKVKRKAKPIEEDLREPYRRNRYMKPLKYKQTFPAYGANNMIMQQTENQRNNRILSDLTQRVNQYERLLKQKPNPINKFIIREAQEIKEEDIPEEVEEETERLEEELEQQELMKIEQEIEEQEEELKRIEELSKGNDIEEAETLMKEIEESLKKGISEPRTPPNEPEQLEPGSFGGASDIVQAVPIPVGEGSNIPVADFPEDFPPPPPAEESKAAEEPPTEAKVLPPPTDIRERFFSLSMIQRNQIREKINKQFPENNLFKNKGQDFTDMQDKYIKTKVKTEIKDSFNKIYDEFITGTKTVKRGRPRKEIDV